MIIVAALGIMAFSGLVMVLWNSILPAVLHVGAITLWQAAGILLLCKLLFGGRGRRGMGGWKKKQMWMRWQQMSPDERAQFGGHRPCYVNVSYHHVPGNSHTNL